MSAFVVSDDHIKALAAFVTIPRPGAQRITASQLVSLGGPRLVDPNFDDIASAIATILLTENIVSVNFRYQASTKPVQAPGMVKVLPSEIFHLGKLSAVQVLKLARCLRYQSCEHPGYEDSAAHYILCAIRDRAIDALPGYDDADWGLLPETVAALSQDDNMAHGYICKRYSGPAPVGIGYVAQGRAAADASQGIEQCRCGYSVKPQHMVKLAADTINGVYKIDSFPVDKFVYWRADFIATLADDFEGVRYGAVSRDEYQQIADEYGVSA